MGAQQPTNVNIDLDRKGRFITQGIQNGGRRGASGGGRIFQKNLVAKDKTSNVVPPVNASEISTSEKRVFLNGNATVVFCGLEFLSVECIVFSVFDLIVL